MFGWWSEDSKRVKNMARCIHEMCSLALHMKFLGSDRPLHNFFLLNPLLIRHSPPTRYMDSHRFWLSDGQIEFRITVNDEAGWVAVDLDGDFNNFTAQTISKGRYLVSVTRTGVTSPEGRLARKLIREFVSNYEAAEISV